MYMAQLNINMTPQFAASLARLMKLRGIGAKSEAIRVAVEECVQRTRAARKADFRAWVGLAAAAPENPKPRFASDDDLWRAG